MTQALQIHSTVGADGTLELNLVPFDIPVPGADEVLIRVEATPINPSDMGVLLAGADLTGAYNATLDGRTVLRAPIPAALLRSVSARVGHALTVGNEGAGTVVAAGTSATAQALLGRVVAVRAGGMYAQYRCVAASDCLALPAGVTPRDGASCFVNPLTALGMVETMRLEGHAGLVHTAAASNLGLMLHRLCLAEDVPLVNIVRNAAQVAMLKDAGAVHVCNSSDPDFTAALTEVLLATRATLAFDAIGGGSLASTILTAMERAANRDPSPANRYGSTIHKQVYLYGSLDPAPTVLNRSYGMAWGVGGWLMPNFLARVGREKSAAMRERVAQEITTTFASHYSGELSLFEALDADTARRYQRKTTGEKFLINPHKDA